MPGALMVFFFFSSRRRHTRSGGDWSSDVCSSDLGGSAFTAYEFRTAPDWIGERSEERRVGKSVDLGGRRIIKKKKKKKEKKKKGRSEKYRSRVELGDMRSDR